MFRGRQQLAQRPHIAAAGGRIGAGLGETGLENPALGGRKIIGAGRIRRGRRSRGCGCDRKQRTERQEEGSPHRPADPAASADSSASPAVRQGMKALPMKLITSSPF